MSLRKSTNSRLINIKYITTDIVECTKWKNARRHCVLLDESIFDNNTPYAKQAIIYNTILGQVSDGTISYKQYGIPNRVKYF